MMPRARAGEGGWVSRGLLGSAPAQRAWRQASGPVGWTATLAGRTPAVWPEPQQPCRLRGEARNPFVAACHGEGSRPGSRPTGPMVGTGAAADAQARALRSAMGRKGRERVRMDGVWLANHSASPTKRRCELFAPLLSGRNAAAPPLPSPRRPPPQRRRRPVAVAGLRQMPRLRRVERKPPWVRTAGGYSWH